MVDPSTETQPTFQQRRVVRSLRRSRNSSFHCDELRVAVLTVRCPSAIGRVLVNLNNLRCSQSNRGWHKGAVDVWVGLPWNSVSLFCLPQSGAFGLWASAYAGGTSEGLVRVCLENPRRVTKSMRPSNLMGRLAALCCVSSLALASQTMLQPGDSYRRVCRDGLKVPVAFGCGRAVVLGFLFAGSLCSNQAVLVDETRSNSRSPMAVVAFRVNWCGHTSLRHFTSADAR